MRVGIVFGSPRPTAVLDLLLDARADPLCKGESFEGLAPLLSTGLASLQQLLAGDRLGSSFLVDLGLYAAFQSWLIPDDLKRRGVELDSDRARPLQRLGYVPFVGLIGYLLLRPRYPATRE